MKPRIAHFLLLLLSPLFFWSLEPISGLQCFICEFNINYCKTPNCYHNQDICSPNQFSQVLVPLQECPHNCMLKAVTNPAGIVLKWKRLCAPASDLTHGFNCRIDYVFGARIEQCTCDKDFCNSTQSVTASLTTTICFTALLAIYFWTFQ